MSFMDASPMGILRFRVCRRIPYASILYHGSTGWHTASIYYGKENCTCIGFLTHKHCKHIDMLKEILGDEYMKSFTLKDLVEGKVPIRYADSSIQPLNDAFDGKVYSSGEIFSIYGAPNVGKTLYALQEAYYFASKGMNVLYIDTEGAVAKKATVWHSTFSERFGKLKGQIHFKVIRDIEELMYLFGHTVRITYTSADKKKTKGKLVMKLIETNPDPPIDGFMKEHKIDLVIIDSVTSPFRTRIPISEQQNHPSKSDAQALFYDALIGLQDKHDAFIITTHHESINPASIYDVIPRIRGGTTIKYYSKTIMWLDRRDKKGQTHIRRFWFARSDNADEFSTVVLAQITPMGYIPLDSKAKKNISNLLTAGELDRTPKVIT